MEIYKPRRFSGPLWISIPGITLLSLFLGWIYTGLYNGNDIFRAALPHTWWLWVLPCLPFLWFFWVTVDIVITLCTRKKLLEVVDCKINSEKETILIKIKPTHFTRTSEDKITARCQYIGVASLPRLLRHQKTTYDELNDWYEVRIDASGLLKNIQIHYLFIYVKQGRIIPYHCVYLIHKFKYDWLKWSKESR